MSDKPSKQPLDQQDGEKSDSSMPPPDTTPPLPGKPPGAPLLERRQVVGPGYDIDDSSTTISDTFACDATSVQQSFASLNAPITGTIEAFQMQPSTSRYRPPLPNEPECQQSKTVAKPEDVEQNPDANRQAIADDPPQPGIEITFPFGHQVPPLTCWEKAKQIGCNLVHNSNVHMYVSSPYLKLTTSDRRLLKSSVFVLPDDFIESIRTTTETYFRLKLDDSFAHGRYGFVFKAMGPPPPTRPKRILRNFWHRNEDSQNYTTGYAVKVFPFQSNPPKELSPEDESRLERYWRKVAKLEKHYSGDLDIHPNIVRFFGYHHGHNEATATDDRNGDPYSVMVYELMDTSLGKILDDGKVHFSPKQLGRLGEQIGSALDYMHRRQLVHHDVKPENIVAGPFNASNSNQRAHQLDQIIYKLIDFSSVRKYLRPMAEASETRPDTNFGITFHRHLGTNGYFSPEKADKDMLYNPYKADSYSFGVTLLKTLAIFYKNQTIKNAYETDKATKEVDKFVEGLISPPKGQYRLPTKNEARMLEAIRPLIQSEEKNRSFVGQVLSAFKKLQEDEVATVARANSIEGDSESTMQPEEVSAYSGPRSQELSSVVD